MTTFQLRSTSAVASSRSTIPGAVFSLILFCTLFLTRFGLSAEGRYSELGLVLVVLLLGVGLLALTGLIELSVPRAILYTVAMTFMMLSTLLGSTGKTSPTSLLNLICLYFCYVFVAPDPSVFDQMIRLFRKFMLIIAFFGIGQFFAQVVIPGPFLFSFDWIFPYQVLTHGFNVVIPVPGLEYLNKSNGFFLLEPSSLSQMATLAIIVELEFFRLSWRLAVLGLALLLAFSGTGLIMFLAVVPWMLIARGRGRVVLIAIPTFALLAFVASELQLTHAFDRLSEFNSDQSSAFARFISPFYLFSDYVFTQMRSALFGLGPGSIEPFFDTLAYQIHDPTWGKLLFEYGLVGGLPFAVFVLYCFFVGARSLWLNTALFINYLILGGNLLDARLNALILVLAIFQNRPGGSKVAAHMEEAPKQVERRPRLHPFGAWRVEPSFNVIADQPATPRLPIPRLPGLD